MFRTHKCTYQKKHKVLIKRLLDEWKITQRPLALRTSAYSLSRTHSSQEVQPAFEIHRTRSIQVVSGRASMRRSWNPDYAPLARPTLCPALDYVRQKAGVPFHIQSWEGGTVLWLVHLESDFLKLVEKLLLVLSAALSQSHLFLLPFFLFICF